MIIGIDLGTTNSLAAYYTDEGPKIIPNRLGRRLTPSVVSMDVETPPHVRSAEGEEYQIYVGDSAVERGLLHPGVRPASLNVIWEAGSSFIWVIKAFWLRNSPPLCSGR